MAQWKWTMMRTQNSRVFRNVPCRLCAWVEVLCVATSAAHHKRQNESTFQDLCASTTDVSLITVWQILIDRHQCHWNARNILAHVHAMEIQPFQYEFLMAAGYLLQATLYPRCLPRIEWTGCSCGQQVSQIDSKENLLGLLGFLYLPSANVTLVWILYASFNTADPIQWSVVKQVDTRRGTPGNYLKKHKKTKGFWSCICCDHFLIATEIETRSACVEVRDSACHFSW